MITPVNEKYCENCPDYNPEAISVNLDDKIITTYVRCIYWEQCARLVSRLKQTVE